MNTKILIAIAAGSGLLMLGMGGAAVGALLYFQKVSAQTKQAKPPAARSEELQGLEAAYKAGILSKEEFESKKRELVSGAGPNQPRPMANPTIAAAPGSYYRMRLVKIVDTGFGQPAEVVRFLIPADWRDEGGVRWDNNQLRCPSNIIQFRYRAVSPDGLSAIEFMPSYTWQAASDPMMAQTMRQSASMGQGCDVGPVTNSTGFLQQSVVARARPGARMVSADRLPEMSRAKQAQLAQSLGPMVQAGLIRGFQADAGAVRISYAQGGQQVEEWLHTSVISIASASANTAALMQGQVSMSASTYSMISDGVVAVRMPAGRFDGKLAATMLASIRLNPEYQAAASQFISNMGNISLRGTMDRARIWREASQQVSATITQSYQHQQAVQDRAAAQFSDSIRGVEQYVNPRTGERVELTGGYTNAWVNNRGEYLLSTSEGFNPAVELREDWTQLGRAGR